MNKKLKKDFGKLSPDDQFSASMTPQLFEVPHKVLDKLRKIRASEYTEPIYPPKMLERMEMGNVMEELILRLTEEALGIQINYPIDEVMSIEIGRANKKPVDIYASLDAIAYVKSSRIIAPVTDKIMTPGNKALSIVGPMIVEIKNMQAPPYKTIEEMIEPPYGRGWLQTNCQALIAGAKFCCVSVLFNGNDHRMFIAPADKKLHTKIKSKALALYHHLEHGTLYDPHDAESAAEKYGHIKSNNVLPLPESLAATVRLYEDLCDTSKEIEKEKDKCQKAMIESLGEHERGQIACPKSGLIELERKSRHYKAQAQRFVPAKPERDIRSKIVKIKHLLEKV